MSLQKAIILSTFVISLHANSGELPDNITKGSFKKLQEIALGRIQTASLNNAEKSRRARVFEQQQQSLFTGTELDNFRGSVGVHFSENTFTAIKVLNGNIEAIIGLHSQVSPNIDSRSVAETVAWSLYLPVDKIRATSYGSKGSSRSGHSLYSYGFTMDANLPIEVLMKVAFALEDAIKIAAQKNLASKKPKSETFSLVGPVL